MAGFLKLNRSDETDDLLKDKNAFMLLTQIALRARRFGSSIHELKIGEAMIGDHRNVGLTQREYRTAKGHLVKYGLATFRTTNRGTIAKILNTAIYDINIDESDKQNDKQVTFQ